ncbi:MAG TPA: type II secretion system F family protein [Steroidobacteraceae bacterium]|nr:type II secretion system F family protein [Steroidobacteraceae bacterium]
MKFNVRADLFGQLATLEEAGLPFDKVIDIVHLPPKEGPRLQATRKWIRRGVGIAEAGRRSGLFTPLEASLVRAATVSGSPARTYRLLADQCARRAARIKAIRSRMTVPAVMIAVWIILGPVPALVTGSLTVGGYLAKHLLPWIGVAVIAYLLLPLLRRLDGVLPFVPLFGPMEVRRNLRDFFDSLAILLEAGVPILEAFPTALGTVRNQAIKSQLAQIKPRIDAGTSFTQAIAGLPLFGGTQAYELIRTGEASGALPRMLSRHSEAETAAINRFDDLVAEWIPRLAYVATALVVGYGIIHSGAFMPSLPQDLR